MSCGHGLRIYKACREFCLSLFQTLHHLRDQLHHSYVPTQKHPGRSPGHSQGRGCWEGPSLIAVACLHHLGHPCEHPCSIGILLFLIFCVWCWWGVSQAVLRCLGTIPGATQPGDGSILRPGSVVLFLPCGAGVPGLCCMSSVWSPCSPVTNPKEFSVYFCLGTKPRPLYM